MRVRRARCETWTSSGSWRRLSRTTGYTCLVGEGLGGSAGKVRASRRCPNRQANQANAFRLRARLQSGPLSGRARRRGGARARDSHLHAAEERVYLLFFQPRNIPILQKAQTTPGRIPRLDGARERRSALHARRRTALGTATAAVAHWEAISVWAKVKSTR